MNRLIYLLSTGVCSAIALALLTSATTPVQQTNDYTNQLTQTSEGRQISVLAPAPQAPMMTALGVGFGVAAMGCLWKSLEGLGDSSNNKGAGTIERDTISDVQSAMTSYNGPARLSLSPDDVGNVPSELTLQTSKLKPLLYAGLVSVVGLQGSGKSTLLAGLIRERLKAGHRVIVINHHAAYQEYRPLKVYGMGSTLEKQISHCEEGLQLLIDTREARYNIRKNKPQSDWLFMDDPITFIVEEMGEYKGVANPDLMTKAIKTIVSGVRKANIYVVLSSQHDSMEMFGGTSGMAKLLQNGFAKIELVGQPNESLIGGLGASGTGWLTINGSKPELVKVPDCSAMFPRHQDPMHFDDLFSTDQPLSSGTVTQNLNDEVESPMVLLERSLSLPSYEPDEPDDDNLDDDERVILNIAKSKKVPLTARDIMKTNRVSLNADEIRIVFVRLSNLEYGSIEGEGKKLTFQAF